MDPTSRSALSAQLPVTQHCSRLRLGRVSEIVIALPPLRRPSSRTPPLRAQLPESAPPCAATRYIISPCAAALSTVRAHARRRRSCPRHLRGDAALHAERASPSTHRNTTAACTRSRVVLPASFALPQLSPVAPPLPPRPSRAFSTA
ncbi:hypothetical protein HYPSUDRAFT_204711 [Hypholoma sublateritium FD-334 SS-4]|uniref:Uncharacterized protein n=1 Tax=Hypholoma sublateritium (strain FD-334 SS-4) TaxID=945553 RepID=A0A0D2NK97_HYPSF|nr:hypothetical protein HYPSUDRAFT_204711 [Hypholoma sublateritium FD-334 SS-4]